MKEKSATTSAVVGALPNGGPVMRSPAHRLHAELGAKFSSEAGWELPASYGDTEKERVLVKESVAVSDVTARAKIDVRGRTDATPVGGGPELVARISDQWALLFRPPGSVADRVRELEGRAGTAAMVTDVTHLYAAYLLTGPLLPDLLSRLTSWDPDTLAPGQAAGAPIAEIRAVLVRRDLAFPAVEAYVATEFGRYAWESILQVAHGLGGGPAGWDAIRAKGWS